VIQGCSYLIFCGPGETLPAQDRIPRTCVLLASEWSGTILGGNDPRVLSPESGKTPFDSKKGFRNTRITLEAFLRDSMEENYRRNVMFSMITLQYFLLHC